MSAQCYVLALSLAIVLQLVSSQDCKDSTILTCQNAFNGSHAAAVSLPLDASLPVWNETLDQLKDRCQRYERFSLCMNTVTPYCNSTMSDYFKGLDSAYSLLCSEQLYGGLAAFAQYELCYSQQSVTDGASFCNDTYYSKLQTLNSINVLPVYVSNFCSYTDNYLTCLQNAVSSSCNSSAVSWLKSWNQRLRIYLLSDDPFNCPGWSVPTDNTTTIWTIVLSVVLGLTTLLMIIGVIIILIFINRKKKSIRRSVIPPPPPYSSDMEFPQPGEVTATVEGLGCRGGGVPTVVMRPAVQLPVLPPPYAGEQAPDYEPVGASSGGYEGEVGEKKEEKEERDPGEEGGTDRDLSSAWF